MSNTGRKKKLASFNCDQELWAEFMRRCQEKGTTATATLTRFIELYLDGSLEHLDVYLGKGEEKTLDERIRACLDEYLAERLPLHLDSYLANNQGNLRELQNTVVGLSKKISDMEAQTASSKSPTRTNTNKTNSTPKREFWFIKERAKHLGFTINADQFIRIEMFASDSYKQRHGKPPERQLLRKTPAVAYPVADIDLLDAAIKGVVALG